MKKRRLPQEAVYLVGILLMALGVACVSRSSFGYSMIVAPAYLIYTKFNILTFGTIEYLWQGLLLIITCLILRRFKIGYLFSFVTAVLYGLTFDGCLKLVGILPFGTAIGTRAAFFVCGTIFISFAVALFVRTYIAPEVYELFVKEFSARYHFSFSRVKFAYDVFNFLLAVTLSISMFGIGAFANFTFSGFWSAVKEGYVLEGIGIGTLLATLVNGPLIGLFGKWIDHTFALTICFPRLACFFKNGHFKEDATPQEEMCSDDPNRTEK